MNDSQLTALAQIRDFLTGTAGVAFAPAADDATRFRFIAQVLRRFGCPTLARLDKGLIRRYLAPHHRLFARQLTRLLRRHRQAGGLSQRYAAPKAGFRRHYTAAEVSLLAEVDALHGTLPGPATRVLLERAPRVYGDVRFERLAALAVAHLYNLRQHAAYRKVRRHWTRTRPTPAAIGVRKPPRPDGRPSFIRIDSVHQGDQDRPQGPVPHQRRGLRHPVAVRGHDRAHY